MKHYFLPLLICFLTFCESPHKEPVTYATPTQSTDSNSIFTHRVNWLTQFDSTVFFENEKKAEWLDQYRTILTNSVKACPLNIRKKTNTGSFYCFQIGGYWRSLRFEKKEQRYEITHDLLFDNNLQLFNIRTVDDPDLFAPFERAYNNAKIFFPEIHNFFFYPESNNALTVYVFPAFEVHELGSIGEPCHIIKMDSSGITIPSDIPNSFCEYMGDTKEYRRLDIFPDDRIQPDLYQHYFIRHYTHVWDTVRAHLSHNIVSYFKTSAGLKCEIGPAINIQ